MFTKILIANRAEIACRIIKTTRCMGVATVAVYSDADRDALHVQMADEAVHIGGAMAAESYLDGDKIIAACKKTGAEAVHPGYGFLSENAAFARQLEHAGIVFIGPGAQAIESMGDKIASKALAHKAGVNTIPGHADVVVDAAEAMKIAEQIGYPVMIKASAGGGGKGMRVARHRDEIADGFARASSEALSSFGDQRILLEKFIDEPRHIEIQIIADAHGNIVTLNERECSIQRRHQKVIEETPSPFINNKTRAAMSEQAIVLAKAVDYRSAGTVEMIVDAAHNFYFLEMNTRLQVEHPVTEMITGFDLVELMLRVAAGEKLPIKQSDVAINGWAMEARIYAENPYRNFMPSSGRLVRYLPPTISHDKKHAVRVDSGVEEGGEISRFYDPLIAKLITWGDDRAAAIRHMRLALDAYYIRGVDTNQPFAAAIMAHPRFQQGDLSTNFIEQEYPDGFARAINDKMDWSIFVVIAASLHHRLTRRAATISGQLLGYGRTIGSRWVVAIDGAYYSAKVSGAPGNSRVEYNGDEYHIEDQWRATEPVYRCQVNGAQVHMQFERRGYDYALAHGGCQISVKVLSPRVAELHALMPRKAPPDQSRFLLSPMPGLLVSVAVKSGASVKAGQELAVIEAMKMENSLRAEQDGVVEEVLAEPGAIVQADQPILKFAIAQANNRAG